GVHIGVVAEHIDRVGGGVLGHRGAVVDRVGGVVDVGDGDRHRRGVGEPGGVGDGVGEGVPTDVAGGRGVGQPGARAGDGHGAVGALGDRGDGAGVAGVHIGVVDQHIDRVGAGVLGHGGAVIDGDRGVV